jgi:hypothetical protein
LLKKRTSFTVYRLLTKENKLTFSACGGKQTEVCRFRFPLAANKLELSFSVSFVFRVHIYAAVSKGKRKPT